jgi:dUTP pyrophosphatase
LETEKNETIRENQTMNNNFQIIRLSDDLRLKIPSRATAGSAGFDLQAIIEESITLFPGEHRKIPTGLKIWIRAEHLVGVIVPKSGKGSAGFGIKNFTGVIDSDYQGEIIVNIWNTNEEAPIIIEPFMQIAQIIFLPFVAAVFTEVGVFYTGTERGEGGFGHTEKPTNMPTIEE